MNKIYIITGPAGVGKSTISKMVAKRLDKSVLIEGDFIYHLVEFGYVSAWKEGNHLELFWKNVYSLIENALSLDYDVVFNYIVHKDDFEILKKRFKDYEINFTVLLVNEEELLRRDGLRSEDVRMNERCLILLKKFKDEFINTIYVIDSSNLTEEETYERVIKNDIK